MDMRLICAVWFLLVSASVTSRAANIKRSRSQSHSPASSQDYPPLTSYLDEDDDNPGKSFTQSSGEGGKVIQTSGPGGKSFYQYSGPDGKVIQSTDPNGQTFYQISGPNGKFMQSRGPDGKTFYQVSGPNGKVMQSSGPDGKAFYQVSGPNGKFMQSSGPGGKTFYQFSGSDGKLIQYSGPPQNSFVQYSGPSKQVYTNPGQTSFTQFSGPGSNSFTSGLPLQSVSGGKTQWSSRDPDWNTNPLYRPPSPPQFMTQGLGGFGASGAVFNNGASGMGGNGGDFGSNRMNGVGGHGLAGGNAGGMGGSFGMPGGLPPPPPPHDPLRGPTLHPGAYMPPFVYGFLVPSTPMFMQHPGYGYGQQMPGYGGFQGQMMQGFSPLMSAGRPEATMVNPMFEQRPRPQGEGGVGLELNAGKDVGMSVKGTQVVQGQTSAVQAEKIPGGIGHSGETSDSDGKPVAIKLDTKTDEVKNMVQNPVTTPSVPVTDAVKIKPEAVKIIPEATTTINKAPPPSAELKAVESAGGIMGASERDGIPNDINLTQKDAKVALNVNGKSTGGLGAQGMTAQSFLEGGKMSSEGGSMKAEGGSMKDGGGNMNLDGKLMMEGGQGGKVQSFGESSQNGGGIGGSGKGSQIKLVTMPAQKMPTIKIKTMGAPAMSASDGVSFSQSGDGNMKLLSVPGGQYFSQNGGGVRQNSGGGGSFSGGNGFSNMKVMNGRPKYQLYPSSFLVTPIKTKLHKPSALEDENYSLEDLIGESNGKTKTGQDKPFPK